MWASFRRACVLPSFTRRYFQPNQSKIASLGKTSLGKETKRYGALMGTTKHRYSSFESTSQPIFEYHILTEKYREEAQKLVSQAFLSEPNNAALNERRPMMKIDFQDLMEFTDHFMEHCSTNGLSMVAVDKSNNRVAGTLLVKDFHFDKPELAEIYCSPDCGLSAIFDFLSRTTEAAIEVRPYLGKKNIQMAELFMVGIYPDYRSNNVAGHLVAKAGQLIQEVGYHYAVGLPTNVFSAQILAANGFECLVEQKISEWKFYGEAVLENTKPPHGVWSFWVKDIRM